MSAYYRQVTIDRQTARRAINAGRASLRPITPRGVAAAARDARPAPAQVVSHPDIRTGPPQPRARVPFNGKPMRKPFGVGILRSLPTYRLDCTLDDDAWWQEESRREEDRMIDRLAAEYEAQQRNEMGLDA